jgi:hypothetical protein
MASLPVAWMASTIADGAAGTAAQSVYTHLRETMCLTSALDRYQLVFQVALNIIDAAELIQRV